MKCGDKKIIGRNSCTNRIWISEKMPENRKTAVTCHIHTKGDKLQLQRNLPIKCML